MDHGRWAARLRNLSRERLLSLAAAGCASSTVVAQTANESLAKDHPLPEWAVNGVLVNTDLISHVFAALRADGAAEGWTNRGRGRAGGKGRRFMSVYV